MVLKKTPHCPLDSKEIKPVNPKGNQSWIFIAKTDVEAETSILWPPSAKNWLIGKDPENGKDWRQEEKGMTEDEMVGWHHRLDGHEFEQAPGIGEVQGGLACCSPRGSKESNTTSWLNWSGRTYFTIWNWRSLSCFTFRAYKLRHCDYICSGTHMNRLKTFSSMYH